jgi:prevent-host-death family protein
MQTITLRDANQNFSKYITAVEQGQAFIVTKHGREVARIMPVAALATDGVPDAVVQAQLQTHLEALADRLSAYKLPHSVQQFSRSDCYDE